VGRQRGGRKGVAGLESEQSDKENDQDAFGEPAEKEEVDGPAVKDGRRDTEKEGGREGGRGKGTRRCLDGLTFHFAWRW